MISDELYEKVLEEFDYDNDEELTEAVISFFVAICMSTGIKQAEYEIPKYGTKVSVDLGDLLMGDNGVVH